MKIERITWHDSQAELNSYWWDKDAIEDFRLETEIQSVGYVLKDSHGYILLAASKSESQYGGIISIPADSIINREVLRKI